MAIAAVTAFASLWRLTTPSWHVDEILFAITGRSMLAGDFSRLWQHPPLAMFLYGLGQELPGSALLGVRLVAAAAGMATGALVYVLARRVASQRAAFLAAAFWAVLPHVTHPLGADVLVPRLDRYALLDVVAAALMAGALVTGWRWVSTARPRSWRATGLLVGLAAAAKLSGLLVLPGIAAFAIWRRGRRAGGEVLQAVLVATAAFAACYVPFGTTALDALRRMVAFQSEHLERGHSVVVGGTVRQHAPWWTQFDYMWTGDGPLVVVPLVVAAVLAVVLLRRPAVTYVAVAVLVPVVVMAASSVSLPHYRYVWLAPFLVLAAVGFDRALAGGRALRLAAIAMLVPLAIAGAATTWRIATVERADFGAAADLIRDSGLSGGRLLAHGHSPVFRGELPSMDLVWSGQAATRPPDVVVVDRQYEQRHPRPDIRAIARGRGLVPVRVDRLDVYLPRRVAATRREAVADREVRVGPTGRRTPDASGPVRRRRTPAAGSGAGGGGARGGTRSPGRSPPSGAGGSPPRRRRSGPAGRRPRRRSCARPGRARAGARPARARPRGGWCPAPGPRR